MTEEQRTIQFNGVRVHGKFFADPWSLMSSLIEEMQDHPDDALFTKESIVKWLKGVRRDVTS